MQQFSLTSGYTTMTSMFQCTPHSRKTSYIVCLWQLVLELSLSTLVVQPRRHKRVPSYFTCACSKQADQSVVESILIPQRVSSFWSALQIATSGRTGFSKHGQSISFCILSQSHLPDMTRSPWCFCARSDNRVWPEVEFLDADQKERVRKEIILRKSVDCSQSLIFPCDPRCG